MKVVTLRTDLYTRIILTIMALALVVNVFRGSSAAVAQGGTVSVNIDQVGGEDVNYGGPLKVELGKEEAIPVDIKAVGGDSVDPVRYRSHSGGLPVEVFNDIDCNCK